MSLLRTLFIIAVIYLAVRFITQYILPLLVKSAVNKAEEKIMNKMDEMYKNQNRNNEGEISMKYNKSSEKNKRKDDEGEYVEYEEVK